MFFALVYSLIIPDYHQCPSLFYNAKLFFALQFLFYHPLITCQVSVSGDTAQPTLPQSFFLLLWAGGDYFHYFSLYNRITTWHLGTLWDWAPPNSFPSLEKKEKKLLSLNSICVIHIKYLMLKLFYFPPASFSFYSPGREECVHHGHITSPFTPHLLVTDWAIIYFILFHKSLMAQMVSLRYVPALLSPCWLAVLCHHSSRAPTFNFGKLFIPPSVIPAGLYAFLQSIANTIFIFFSVF